MQKHFVDGDIPPPNKPADEELENVGQLGTQHGI